MDWQHVAILIVDRAGGDLEELVNKHAGGRCGDLALSDLGEHLFFQGLVLLACLGRQGDVDVNHARGWQVGAVADQDEREVSELVVDRLLGSCDEFVGVTHVIGRIKVGVAVGGEGLAEALAVVEHLDLHEKI